jgi:hypothetical protein
MRVVLSLLREAEGSLSTKAITLHVMAQQGVDAADKAAFELWRNRVRSMLRHHRATGHLRAFPAEDGAYMVWEIAPND